MEVLEKDILKLEKEFQQFGSKELYNSLVSKKLKYNTLDTYKTERTILKTKQKYYQLGEKARKVATEGRGKFKDN